MTRAITKEMRRPFGDCHPMYRMLKDYEKLGEATVVIRGGIRVTQCPTASAHGIGHRATAGGGDDSRRDWSDRKGGQAECAETRLAKAKLLVMLETLAGRARDTSNYGQKQALALQSRSWFFNESDFEWWCEAAGYDPDRVRRKARKIVDGVAGLNMPTRKNGWKPEEIDLPHQGEGEGHEQRRARFQAWSDAGHDLHDALSSEKETGHRRIIGFFVTFPCEQYTLKTPKSDSEGYWRFSGRPRDS